ncbi:hypothetical protein, partial [Spirillospora sp. NPDC048819]|uniref:hypothetical protein n=1 Tax=Spirillospora sp. NPDC048819 TaxID=3155268 RepID=UPI0033F0BC6B
TGRGVAMRGPARPSGDRRPRRTLRAARRGAAQRPEGLDASPYGDLWRQVREMVARAFEEGGGATP